MKPFFSNGTHARALGFVVLSAGILPACSGDDDNGTTVGPLEAGTDEGGVKPDAGRKTEGGSGGSAEASVPGTGAEPEDGGFPDKSDGEASADTGPDHNVIGGDRLGPIPGILLFGFDLDDSGDAGLSGWYTRTIDAFDAGLAPTLRLNPNQGSPSPGALEFTIPFTDYGQSASAEHDFGESAAIGAQNWAGRTRLHARVALAAATGVGLGSVSLFVQVGSVTADGGLLPYSQWDGASVAALELSDHAWHEIVLDLRPDAGFAGDLRLVNKIGIQAATPFPAPDGGPPRPSGTTLYIDSISLE